MLPQMVTIPAGVFCGAVMGTFRLGRTPVTNEQYAAHVDRHSSAPFVLLATDPKTHDISILCRTKTPIKAIVDLTKGRLKKWDSRDPFCFGLFTLFQLRKDMSPEGFHCPEQPVVNVSWYHAYEYCVGNGLFLPSHEQWSYAARVHKGRRYATSTDRLYAGNGKKLAHFGCDPDDGTDRTIDVDDPRYPDGPYGLRHMTGNVLEWTDRRLTKEGWRYGQRGGCFASTENELHSGFIGGSDVPSNRSDCVGFRVAAASR